ncbi:MAG TPA: HAMP domain-containing sensor histidine kinase [Chryseolinea sp.]|nr:HAMP domain-containing sensor histidine kinase [Chryseolinea sp.]
MMTSPLIKLLDKILYCGTVFSKSPAQKRGIILSNAIGLVLFVMATLLFVMYYIWYGWNFVTFAIPIIGLSCLAVIPLNYKGYNDTARIWISLIVPIVTTLLSIYSKILYYDQQEELDYFTFRFAILGSCVIPWLLFSLQEKKFLITCSIIGLVLLMSYDPLHHVFGVPYQQEKLKVMNYYFTNVVIFVVYWALMAHIIFLKGLSESTETRNAQLISQLNEVNDALSLKNSEIQIKNAEILDQSDILQKNQDRLWNANQIIEGQRRMLLQKNASLQSELVQANKILTETNTELIKHNNELSQFSFSVSHNLRGPVASLLGLIALFDQKSIKGENAEIFKHIQSSTDRLDTIIKDLIKIIDIRQDIFQIRQKISLEQEFKSIHDILEQEIYTHHVAFRNDFSKCEEIYSVKPMVHSILYNLISNSIKYRALDDPPVIEIFSEEQRDQFTITVKDNGLGIDLNTHRDDVFKLYHRFHRHVEGRGLGLYLVKLQCEALGGTVHVESELNKFTKFTLHLPKPENLKMQVLFDELYAKVVFDATTNSTSLTWRGPVTSAQYRSVFSKAIEILSAYSTPNWISDISQQGPVSKEDQIWMFTTILPEAAKNGLKRIASIQPIGDNSQTEEYLAALALNISKFGILFKTFRSHEETLEWIQDESEKATSFLKS